MEVATDIGDLDEVERFCCARTLPELRRTIWEPESVEEVELRCCVGESTERSHVVRRPGRAEQLCAETFWARHDERDWKTVHCQAQGTPLVSLDERDDRGKVCKPVDDAMRVIRGAHDREFMRQLAEPARRACNLAVESRCDLQRKGATPRDRQPPQSSGLARERLKDLRFGNRPDARNLTKATALRGLHKFVDRPQIEMARDVNYPLRSKAKHAPESDERRIKLCLEHADLGNLAGLDQLTKLRRDSKADSAEVAHATGADDCSDGRGRGANGCLRARRYARTANEDASENSSSVANKASRSAIHAFVGSRLAGIGEKIPEAMRRESCTLLVRWTKGAASRSGRDRLGEGELGV